MDLLLGYIAVGIWLNICMVIGVKKAGLDFASFGGMMVAAFVHTLCWPFSIYALVLNAMQAVEE